MISVEILRFELRRLGLIFEIFFNCELFFFLNLGVKKLKL